MKTEEQKTNELNGLRKYIRAKLMQESGQNPFEDVLKHIYNSPPAHIGPKKS